MLRTAVVVVAAGLTLAACGGSSSDTTGKHAASTSASASSTTAASPYLPVPSGVVLTRPGSTLAPGDTATVAWHPRQDVVAALRITVSSVQRTTFEQSFAGWQVPDSSKTMTPYFVTAQVTNVGDGPLGGVPVPLYGASTADTLVEPSSFAASFEPCTPGVLPTPFPAGATATTCQVFLVPNMGELKGVTFRPTQDFKPITWAGGITTLTPSPAPTPGKKHRGASSSASPTATATAPVTATATASESAAP